MGSEPGDVAAELVDVVDQHDRVIGTVTRGEMRARRLLHRAVFIAVRHPDGRVLVHQRSPHKDLWPSRWDFAVGGVVSAGESYDAAAARELAEEVGVRDVVPERLGHRAFENADVALLATCYRVTSDGPFTFDDGEVVSVEWVEPDDLPACIAERKFVPDSLALIDELLRD